MSIGKLAAAGGVGVETVRFYQRRGLLTEPDRNGGVRQYDQTDLARLHFIRAAQKGGFTLAEIRELLALDATDERDRVRVLGEARLFQLDQKISELQNVRASLANLVRTCADGEVGPCPIIQAFTSEN